MKLTKLESLENGLIKVQFKKVFGRVATRLVFNDFGAYRFLDTGEHVNHSGIEWFGMSKLKEIDLKINN